MIFHSTIVKILIRFIASLTSAIVVISGFLYVLNLGQKSKEKEQEEEEDVVISFEDDSDDELD